MTYLLNDEKHSIADTYIKYYTEEQVSWFLIINGFYKLNDLMLLNYNITLLSW